MVSFILLNNFNYDTNRSGGGIFFIFSNLFFKNNIFFYVVSFFSISLILKIFFNKKLNDILLIFILIALDPDSYVFHKTYAPLLLCIFLLLFENSLFRKLNKNFQKNFTFNLITFYILVFIMYVVIRTEFMLA